MVKEIFSKLKTYPRPTHPALFFKCIGLFKVRLLYDLKAKTIHFLMKKGFYIYGIRKFKNILKLSQPNLLAIAKTFSKAQKMDGTTNVLKILKTFFEL